jgi:prevent-host-death family protein
MANVSIRELRTHGREVIDRVVAGERLTITRSRKPVAELHPLRSRSITAPVLLQHWRRLPAVDSAALRADLDAAADPTLPGQQSRFLSTKSIERDT